MIGDQIVNGIILEPVTNIFNAGRPDASGIYDNQRQMPTTSYNVAELSIDDHDIPELREFFDEVVKSVMLLLSPTSVGLEKKEVSPYLVRLVWMRSRTPPPIFLSQTSTFMNCITKSLLSTIC